MCRWCLKKYKAPFPTRKTEPFFRFYRFLIFVLFRPVLILCPIPSKFFFRLSHVLSSVLSFRSFIPFFHSFIFIEIRS